MNAEAKKMQARFASSAITVCQRGRMELQDPIVDHLVLYTIRQERYALLGRMFLRPSQPEILIRIECSR
jgi:hypothetical protein